ncbi:MAG: hypothetical protein F4Y02_12980 [Chloroflexi bacterium]|nr:hypothetical protein [Chloroflexota bacterium]
MRRATGRAKLLVPARTTEVMMQAYKVWIETDHEANPVCVNVDDHDPARPVWLRIGGEGQGEGRVTSLTRDQARLIARVLDTASRAETG